MKVLRQDWDVLNGDNVTSISKDKVQLDATIEQVAVKEPEEGGNEFQAEPYGKFEEITIPDDSVFADMVKTRTVFLHYDEMNIIYDAPEYDS